MNKMDIINKLATDINVNQKIAKIAVDTIIDSIKKAIINNERVEIRGFGSFTLREYKAYRELPERTARTAPTARTGLTVQALL